ncbi:MAG: hypothetical protein ACFFC3_12440 [Candidatus Odinarchaeota archaeon]
MKSLKKSGVLLSLTMVLSVVMMLPEITAVTTTIGESSVGFGNGTVMIWNYTSSQFTSKIGDHLNASISSIQSNENYMRVNGTIGYYNHTTQKWINSVNETTFWSYNYSTQEFIWNTELDYFPLLFMPIPLNSTLLSKNVNSTVYFHPVLTWKYNYTSVFNGNIMNLTKFLYSNSSGTWICIGGNNYTYTYNDLGISKKFEMSAFSETLELIYFSAEESDDPIIINAPSNITLDTTYTGVSISWTATDANPNIYTIELQGFNIVTGPTTWSNNTEITYNIPDGLSAGKYNYIVNFTDDFDNSITDTVTITIETAEENGGGIPFGNYYLIFLVIGIISLVIVQKRRKLSS